MMISSFPEQGVKLGAIVYRSGKDDIDSLLANFAADQICEGHRLGGVVQYNGAKSVSQGRTMHLIDLMTGRAIAISQRLGVGAQACCLDPSGLADAAAAVSGAIAAEVELVIVNKFSRQEANGGGLRAEIADAVLAGLPVLTAVPDKLLDAWAEFTGGAGATLACDRQSVEAWWRATSWRDGCNHLMARMARQLKSRAHRDPARMSAA